MRRRGGQIDDPRITVARWRQIWASDQLPTVEWPIEQALYVGHDLVEALVSLAIFVRVLSSSAPPLKKRVIVSTCDSIYGWTASPH